VTAGDRRATAVGVRDACGEHQQQRREQQGQQRHEAFRTGRMMLSN